jgi:hypothetical protein
MEVFIGGISGFDETSLKVVRMLERILTIPSDISAMPNKTPTII